MAKVHGSLDERQLDSLGPQVKLVAGRAADKASEGVLPRIRRERPTLRGLPAVQWTRASKRISKTFRRREPEQLQSASDRNRPRHGDKIDARHRRPVTEKR